MGHLLVSTSSFRLSLYSSATYFCKLAITLWFFSWQDTFPTFSPQRDPYKCFISMVIRFWGCR